MCSNKPKPNTIPLYMYFKLGNLCKCLDNCKLKITDPQKCNDPFECAIREKSDIVKDYTREYGEYNVIKGTREFLKDTRMACFSTRPDNILMWAHYAQYNYGACLEFTPDNRVFDNLYYVNYRTEFPKLNRIGDTYNTLDVLITKSKLWEYENEVRLIKENCQDSFIDFSPNNVNKVILGCRSEHLYDANDDNSKYLKELVSILKRPKYAHVEICQVQVDDNKYALHVKPVPFILWECDCGIVITSLRDQTCLLKKINQILMKKKMKKWDTECIKLENGDYVMESPEFDGECIEFKYQQ